MRLRRKLDLGLVEDIFDPEPRPEDEPAPAWFIAWKTSQYLADVCELADGLKGLQDTVARQAQNMRTEFDRVARVSTDYKLTKKAKAMRAESRRPDHECGRDCDF